MEDLFVPPADTESTVERGTVGFVHSEESFTAVDGPGIRYVVFLAGCGLRCVFCSNPDTWQLTNGVKTEADVLVKRILRKSNFFKSSGGGVTISGGDPLVQPDFSAAICRGVRAGGLTSCIATAGVGSDRAVDVLLKETDICILCIKHFNPIQYARISGVDRLSQALHFAQECKRRGVRLWLQYVVLPGYSDAPEDIDLMIEWIQSMPPAVLERVELLRYHTLGQEKWAHLGLEYQLTGISPPHTDIMIAIRDKVQAACPEHKIVTDLPSSATHR
jgi:pyruvate formate lyase activating enzyme